MKDYLIFDGVSSEIFDADVSAYETYKTPVREIETVSVEGRNGDLVIDHGRYQNIEITYKVFIRKKFAENYRNFCNQVLSKPGYRRLEETMRNDVYRMAMINSEIEPEVGRLARTGSFDITFNCKPQCYLKQGEQVSSFSSGSNIFNPTKFDALPLIRVIGYGTIQIGSYAVTIAQGADSYIDLDCDLHMAFEGTANRANLITLTDWPKLGPGINEISYDSTITGVEIAPRWWQL